MPRYKYIGPVTEHIAPDGVKNMGGVAFPKGEFVDVENPELIKSLDVCLDWFERETAATAESLGITEDVEKPKPRRGRPRKKVTDGDVHESGCSSKDSGSTRRSRRGAITLS